MLRDPNAKAAVAFFAVLVVIVILALSAMPIHGEICHPTNAQHKNCTTENLVLVVAWQIKEALNDWSPAITAIATALIGWFTFTLWRTTGGQLILARDEYISTKQPRIIVINLRSVAESYDDENAMVQVLFANAGLTPAIVTEIGGRVWSQARTVSRQIHGRRMAVSKFTDELMLESGETEIYAIVAGPRMLPSEGMRFASDIFCSGYIQYSDKLGHQHRTAFCRRLSSDAVRWIRLGDETDQEYAY